LAQSASSWLVSGKPKDIREAKFPTLIQQQKNGKTYTVLPFFIKLFA
jgi:hypothetical protein